MEFESNEELSICTAIFHYRFMSFDFFILEMTSNALCFCATIDLPLVSHLFRCN